MSDTKFNISGDNNADKDKKPDDDFEFKIEKPKKDYSQKEQSGELPEASQEEEQKEEIEIELSSESIPDQEEEVPKELPKEELSVKEEPSVQDEPVKLDKHNLEYIEGESEIEVEQVPEGVKEVNYNFKGIPGKPKKDSERSLVPYVFFAVVAILALTSLFFAIAMISAKHKVKENILLANRFALEKDEIKKEKEELQAKIDNLEKAAPITKGVQDQIYKEKEKLEKQLKSQAQYYEDKYNEEAEASLEKYANEAKLITRKVIALNEAYQNDKKGYDQAIARNKELEKSVTELNKSMNRLTQEHRSQEAVFLYNIGVAYARGGLYDEAIEAFRDSLAQEPDNSEAHYNLAVIYETVKGDNINAIKHLQEYIKATPDSLERYQLEVKIDSLKRVLLKKNKYQVSDSVSDSVSDWPTKRGY